MVAVSVEEVLLELFELVGHYKNKNKLSFVLFKHYVDLSACFLRQQHLARGHIFEPAVLKCAFYYTQRDL